MSRSESRAVTLFTSALGRNEWTVSGYNVKRKQLIVAVENFLSETFVCREFRSSCGQRYFSDKCASFMFITCELLHASMCSCVLDKRAVMCDASGGRISWYFWVTLSQWDESQTRVVSHPFIFLFPFSSRCSVTHDRRL